ncbi:MAG: pyridoxamine 5'-phosphate oxidase [Balneolaceae bacterium]
MINEQLQHLRGEYTKHSLDEKEVDKDPIVQFNKWLNEALETKIPEPNAMTLATVDSENKPHSRIMLLKGVDEDGFVFFTNYASNKGRELEHNPHASLCFLWLELERQVRIDGTVEKISQSESEKYFKLRPYQSQLGALASNQSEEIESRKFLENKISELEAKYPEGKVPKPESWGGYRLNPEAIEFWQGRGSRLHDRVKYELVNGEWKIKRLSP